jgi:hypothetical protein
MRTLSLITIILFSSLFLRAADPTDTSYSFTQCEGSSMPYIAPDQDVALPDSLTAVFINHVGRHGARFLSSSKDVTALLDLLNEAKNANQLSAKGTELLKLVNFINENSRNRWGALDSLGMAEERGIASRMLRNYGKLLNNAKISAISSYSPRCVMSMYEFTHQLDRLNNNLEIYTSAGRQNSASLRPFDLDSDFQEWLKEGNWKDAYQMQYETMMPSAPARKLFTDDYAKELTASKAQEITASIFKIVQGVEAMGLAPVMDKYFTKEEANKAWTCTNLSHYLRWSTTTISPDNADIAAQLLVELLTSLDEAAEGKNSYAVMLRFGHAETLMPLLSMLHLDGCYYLTNYFDTTALHWKDFSIVPMGANLQMILARTKAGRLYLRLDLNERPIPLMPGSTDIYTPWDNAKDYILRCIPLHLRP